MDKKETMFICPLLNKKRSRDQKNEKIKVVKKIAKDDYFDKKLEFLKKSKEHPLELNISNPQIYNEESPLKFNIIAKFNRARACTISLPHGDISSPVYMPVGTRGSIKGLLSYDLKEPKIKIMLNNSYHLALQPGDNYLQNKFGLEDNRACHHFMNWNNNILTDSGGFQIASLCDISNRSEEGVEFLSHIDFNEKIFLSPEKCMEIQNNLGTDIIMALDDVISPFSSKNEVYDSCERSIRWLDRCIKAHKRKKEQCLFGIVQGGVDLELREKAIQEYIKRDLPGYAIGGMSGGETKKDFIKVVAHCTKYLPENKPRYLMGIGYPIDLITCALLGVDMFDCVFATRTARFGNAFSYHGQIKLKQGNMKNDFNPIDKDCDCYVCKKYTRSYLHFACHLNPRGAIMLSYHNIYFLSNLMKRFRESIINGTVNEFCKKFFMDYFSGKKYPEWVHFAAKEAGIDCSYMEGNIETDTENSGNDNLDE